MNTKADPILRIEVNANGEMDVIVKDADDDSNFVIESVELINDPMNDLDRYYRDVFRVFLKGHVFGPLGALLVDLGMKGIPVTVSPKGERRISISREDLEHIVTHGAQILGMNDKFDEFKIPTRRRLVEAVANAEASHPLAKMPGFHRFLQTITILREYIQWLPEQHRRGAEMDIKYIERRLEELAMFREFVSSLKMFENQLISPSTSSEIFAVTARFVRRVAEAVGIDLWGNDGSTFDWRE